MPLSTDVKLSKDVQPVFPDRCVSCDRDQPDENIKICTHSIGWHTLLFWSFGKRFCVNVPVCFQCKKSMRMQRFFSLLINFLFIVIGVYVAVYLLDSYEGSFKKWLVMGIAVICILPLITWEIFFPPSIELTAYSETVDYQFKNSDYAEEFAEFNDSFTD